MTGGGVDATGGDGGEGGVGGDVDVWLCWTCGVTGVTVLFGVGGVVGVVTVVVAAACPVMTLIKAAASCAWAWAALLLPASPVLGRPTWRSLTCSAAWAAVRV